LIFLLDIVSLKPTIVLIIGHFLTSVKFRKIPRQYQKSTEKGIPQLGSKFRGPQKTVGPNHKTYSDKNRLKNI